MTTEPTEPSATRSRALPEAREVFLSLAEYAERVGMTSGQLKNLAQRGELARPDVRVGSGRTAYRGWSARTVDDWHAQRGS